MSVADCYVFDSLFLFPCEGYRLFSLEFLLPSNFGFAARLKGNAEDLVI